MFNELDNQRPQIDYPCEWGYKVIGTDVDKILFAIDEAAFGMEYSVTPSNISRNGKYFSLNFTINVPNEVVRDLVYEKLQKDQDVKIVL